MAIARHCSPLTTSIHYWRTLTLGALIWVTPIRAAAEPDLAAALSLTATTDRRTALETVLQRGATPRERAIAGVRLAELHLLLADTEAVQRALTATDRSQLDRNDRRSFDRIKRLIQP